MAPISAGSVLQTRVKYESIYTHYQEMPLEWVAEMDVDVVARAYLFYLLSTTLFTNHGNDADSALLPPLQDLNATRQSTTLSYLYYAAKWLEVGLAKLLPPLIERYPWGDTIDFLDFIQAAVVYQHRFFLLSGLFYDMYYLKERDIAAAQRESVATDQLAAFMTRAYAVFVRSQLLVHISPLIEFNPFAEAEELDRGQGAALVQLSVDDYNEVCQLYEAARLKLVVGRVSDEHRFDVAPPTGRGRETQCVGHASVGTGCKQVVIEEAEETSSDDSEEMAFNMS
ncbi:hypothetical protein JCGZ_19206 [Jatropha curcas]|uniref:Uncharacterized protein n=1 Tax=Jatropha curcas TaxID=180498 RepID=A0A067LJ96_JATCU|nr:hypothetical protein JCGZ_19206 [Jatropha curcas]